MIKKNHTVVRRGTWLLLGTIVLGTVGFLTACSSKVGEMTSAAADSTDQTNYLIAISQPPADEQSGREDNASAAGLLRNLPVRILERSADSGAVSVNATEPTVIPYGDGGEFVVEPGSSNWDTTISITATRLIVGEASLVDYTFGPTGMTFSPSAKLIVPAKMFQDQRGLIPSVIAWLYWDPSIKRWVDMGRYEVAEDGNFYIEIDHFSRYRGLSQGGQ